MQLRVFNTFNIDFNISKWKFPCNRVERLEWGALVPCDNSRVQQEEENVFFLGAFPASFSSIKTSSFYCLVETCTWMNGCRRQIAIFHLSQINPSLLEKHLVVYLYQINKIYLLDTNKCKVFFFFKPVFLDTPLRVF